MSSRWRWMICVLAMFLGACQSTEHGGRPSEAKISTADGQPISICGASNEWVDFIIQLKNAEHCSTHITGLSRLGPDAHWYLMANSDRALLPLQADSELPTNGALWIDLHIPRDTPAGDYRGAVELLRSNHRIAEIPVLIHVYGFSIPDAPTLTIAGEITSAGLRRLYSANLPTSVEPLIEKCQGNRVQLWFSELQPAARWPADTHTITAADAVTCGWSAEINRNHVDLFRGAVTQSTENSWFYAADNGADQLAESVLLKQLRDSEQLYEYLHLADQKNPTTTQNLAGILMRPLNGPADALDKTLTGPLDTEALNQGKQFLSRIITAQQVPSRQRTQWNLQMIRWIAAHSKPEMLSRATDWFWNPAHDGQIRLAVHVDIYNPANNEPAGNVLEWQQLPLGWSVGQSSAIATLPSHKITHAKLSANFNATQLDIKTHTPAKLRLISGFDGSANDLTVNIPISNCDRCNNPPMIDGSLSDWSMDDAILDGKLANSPATVLACFNKTTLFLAFRLENPKPGRCEFFVQPLSSNNLLGNLTTIQCSASGECQASRNIPVECKSTFVNNTWREELAIPWNALLTTPDLPRSLRFNFVYHDANGQQDQWAGSPRAQSNPAATTGILILRDGPGQLIK